MSLASVHPAELHSSHSSSLLTLSHSLEDICSESASWSSPVTAAAVAAAAAAASAVPSSEHVLTIEELRLQMSSCFSCGVCWSASHISLDCSECGGYALERPCPECEGACGAVWKRDLSMSHASSKARWEGKCGQQRAPALKVNVSANSLALAPKLEKLTAKS